MGVEEEKAAFLSALEKDRCDMVTRSVFADWLDEHCMDAEAEEQRRCTTQEWAEAVRWMEGKASECGLLVTHWDDDDTETGTPITYDDLLQAGRDYLEHGDYLTQFGSETARSVMGPIREKFWEHWQTITGEAVDEEAKKTSPFSCSC